MSFSARLQDDPAGSQAVCWSSSQAGKAVSVQATILFVLSSALLQCTKPLPFCTEHVAQLLAVCTRAGTSITKASQALPCYTILLRQMQHARGDPPPCAQRAMKVTQRSWAQAVDRVVPCWRSSQRCTAVTAALSAATTHPSVDPNLLKSATPCEAHTHAVTRPSYGAKQGTNAALSTKAAGAPPGGSSARRSTGLPPPWSPQAVPAEPVNFEMKWRRSSHWGAYSLCRVTLRWSCGRKLCQHLHSQLSPPTGLRDRQQAHHQQNKWGSCADGTILFVLN